jgi:hypothetical protein
MSAKTKTQQVQELRRSSAASPHRNKKAYRRTRKHAGRGWS